MKDGKIAIIEEEAELVRSIFRRYLELGSVNELLRDLRERNIRTKTRLLFRKRHLKALGALFLQVLKLCETAGLVKLGHVALDGTKIKANASKHKAMSYKRMKQREAELKAEVARMLAAAEAADCEEDETFGKDKRGDEMPDWAGDKQKRLAKIQQAMAALEADAKLAAEEERD